MLRSGRAPRGFVLVEALIALVLLMVGALAFAATGVANMRLQTAAARRTAAAALATTRLEQMHSRCSSAAGADSLPGVRGTWQTVPRDNVVEFFDSLSLLEFPGHEARANTIRSASPC